MGDIIDLYEMVKDLQERIETLEDEKTTQEEETEKLPDTETDELLV